MLRMLFICFYVMVCHIANAAELLTYAGSLESVARNGATVPLKEIEVNVFIDDRAEHTGFYFLTESNDSLPWAEQFGTLSRNSELLSSEQAVIGYRHLDRNYVIPVGLLFFPDQDQLKPNASWKKSGGDFRVAGDEVIEGVECWKVKATIGIARHHEFLVSKENGLIESGTQTVFMGPGDRFRLKFQRVKQQTVQNQTGSIKTVITLLQDLKSQMSRAEHDRSRPMSIAQIETASLAMPKLLEAADGTFLSEHIGQINKSVQLQKSRNQRVQGLADSMIGQPLPQFNLQRLNGDEIPSASLKGKTTILHFWDYTNQTLEQPYGQIGYLDFINNRWHGKNVQIYGVAINAKLFDPEQKTQAIRDINKLKQFMKLGYEIVSDSGNVLNSFGNPTRLGQELPLWVVISPEGDIIHYTTGFYPVDTQVGLKEIDSLLQKYESQ